MKPRQYEKEIRELYESGASWNDLGKFGKNKGLSRENIRNFVRAQEWYNPKTNGTPQTKVANFKESKEIKSNGGQISEILVTKDVIDDVDKLLTAHGFDVNGWDLISARSSVWDTFDGEQRYASKIAVQPKIQKIDYDKLFVKFEELKPLPKIEPATHHHTVQVENLEVQDAHFGIAELEDYLHFLTEYEQYIKNIKPHTLVIHSGGDNLHCDNFKSQTTKGTQLEQVDLTQAVSDAFDFFETLLLIGLEYCERVFFITTPGNHDETTGYLLSFALERKFSDNPRVVFDTEHDMRKVLRFDGLMLCYTHGHKAVKDLPQIFATQFATDWGNAVTREAFVGHLHHEQVLETGGIIIRQVPSPCKNDRWHVDEGFIGGKKMFHSFSYNRNQFYAQHVFEGYNSLRRF